MDANYFSFYKNEAKREATVNIYGGIGELDFDTFELINTAAKFQAEFNDATANADTVHVHINSPGGYVFEGLAIYNTIFSSKKKIITYNDGLCASMASTILLAGDEIYAYRNALLMIHNSMGVTMGNVKEVEEQLEAQKKIDASLSTAIEDRLNITAEEVAEKYLNYKNNWFDSSEALDIGFYDKIIQKDKEVPADIKDMAPKDLYNKYAAFFKGKMPKKTHPKPNTMSKPKSFPNLQGALGLDEPLATTDDGSFINDEQKALIENNITGLKSNLQSLKDEKEGEIQSLKDQKATVDAKLEAAQTATQENIDFLKVIATQAGVEDLKDDATAKEIHEAINAKVAELNGKPGASHTTGAANTDDVDSKHDYINFDSSIYDQFNKINN